MFALDLCRARLEYTLKTVSPLHVGAGGPGPHPLSTGKTERTKARGPDYALRLARPGDTNASAPIALPVHFYEERRQCFFVPGSSIRGALRAALHDRLARVLADLASQPRHPAERYRREGQRDVAGQLKEVNPDAAAGHLLVRMLFGTEQRRGQLAVFPAEFPVAAPADKDRAAENASDVDSSEAVYSDLCRPDQAQLGPGAARSFPPKRNAKLRLLTQVRLDRATQASGDGLRTFAALAENQELTGELRLRNFAFWQLGLIALAQQAANAGQLRLGAKTGVGLGQVEIHFTRLDLTWHARVAPKPTDDLYGIGVAARQLGLVGENGLPVPPPADAGDAADSPTALAHARIHARGRGLLGQDGDPAKGTPPTVSLWLVDPEDRTVGVKVSDLAAVPADPAPTAGGPLAACAQRAYTTADPDLIARVLRAAAERTLAAFQMSIAAPGAAGAPAPEAAPASAGPASDASDLADADDSMEE